MIHKVVLETVYLIRFICCADIVPQIRIVLNRDIKKFIKDLLSNPFHANTSGVLQKKGISKDELKSILLDRDIIKKKERIDEPYDDKLGKKKSMFHVIYTVPKRNFESNIKSLYKYYFG